MPRFNYVALDSRGQEAAGVLDAENQNDAVSQLRQAGYFPKSITPEGKGPKKAKAAGGGGSALNKEIKLNINIPFLERKTIKARTLMIFTR
ncbi:MAG: type II secretion system F family protein, partial [Terrimicrobiaceae bacterium]